MILNNANLEAIENLASNIKIPSYNRDKLKAGIVHIGVGNFHRAHQAWYLHKLLEESLDFDWAIVGAGVLPNDREMRKKLISQDYLSTLIELKPNESDIEVVGSIIDYIEIKEGNAPLIKKLTSPSIRIVSTTITEGGYYLDPSTRKFDSTHPDIQHDVANPDNPKTAFGTIVAALKLRKIGGTGPFTCLSCDNLQNNGNIMRQTIVSLAKLSDPDLSEWINMYCSFPNSMVDCIVPATGPNELGLVKKIGIDDAIPVTHENFRQWVIEDDFCAGRPQWEKVGVTFLKDVREYEKMKIRMLNGGHQVIAAIGDLFGLETISSTINHPLINDFFRKVLTSEIVPHVTPVPEYTPEQYLELITRRFSNPAIVDTTRRVAFDGSSRHPGFLHPSIRDCLTKDKPIQGLSLVSAIWARYCYGVREDNSTIEPNDPFWDQLMSRAKKAKDNPSEWLKNQSIYQDIGNDPRFVKPFTDWLSSIFSIGLEKTLLQYIKFGKA